MDDSSNTNSCPFTIHVKGAAEQIAGGVALALALPEPRPAGGGVQFERLGLLPPGDLQGMVEERRLLDRVAVHVEENLCPQPVELGIVEVLSLRPAYAPAGDDAQKGARQQSGEARYASDGQSHADAGAAVSHARNTHVSSGMTAHVMRATLSSVVITRRGRSGTKLSNGATKTAVRATSG